MYDVIVVGARVAGSSTAMLLARKGYRVLLVDKTTFPSDTLSTHQIQVPGGAALKRWGLLEKLRATKPGIVTGAKLDTGWITLKGVFPALEGGNAVHGPRRTVLDKLLVDAAVEAGAELREGFITEDLMVDNGRINGIRGRSGSGGSITEKARIVIGADGKHSLVAKTVSAPMYHEKPVLTCAYYSYWQDVPVEMGEMYSFERRTIGVWPTNDELTMIYTAWPLSEFNQYRSDVEGNYLKTIDLAPNLAERVRTGRRAERIMGTADLPNFFRKPYGPGWALVGDAGSVKDPITGMGISDALRDAELLANAVDDGFTECKSLEQALDDYEQKRNKAALPMYQFTLDLASLKALSVEQKILFEALQHDQERVNQFFGVITGVIPVDEFLSGSDLFRLLGISGMAKVMLSKMLSPRRRTAQPARMVEG